MDLCLWVDIFIKKGTEGGVIKDVLSPITAQRPVDVVQLREEGVRQGREEGDQPDQGYDLKETFQSGI